MLSALDRVRAFSSPARPTRFSGEPPPRRGTAITICLLVSTLLWFTFSMREEYPEIYDIPVQVIESTLPESQALAALPSEEVRVQFVANGYELLNLWLDPPEILVDATENRIDLLEQAQRSLPGAVSVTSVNPRELILEREARAQRRVPIVLRDRISIPNTHTRVGPVQFDPDSVTISGAASVIETIDAWPTMLVEQEGLNETLTAEVSLSDTLRGLVQKSATRTTMRLEVGHLTQGERLFEVQIIDAPPSDRQLVSLDPSHVTVSYVTLLSQYENVASAPDFFVTVSFTDIRNDTTGRVRPIVNIPANYLMEDVQVTPATLRYWEVVYESDPSGADQ